MATQKKQDVELGVAVNVTNGERIEALGKELRELARDGALSTGEFQKLTNELKELTVQSAAVGGLEKIENDLRVLATAMVGAREKAQQLGTELTEQAAKTAGFRDSQQLAAKTLNESKKELIGLKEALDVLRASTDKAGKDTDDYRDKHSKLKVAIALTEAAISRERLELAAANKEYSESEAALKKVAKAHDDANKSLQTSVTKTQEQSQALQKAQTALTELGVTSTTAAIAQNELAAALDKVSAESAEATLATEKLIANQKLIADLNVRVLAARQAAARQAASDDAAATVQTDALAAAMKRLVALNDAVEKSEREIANQARIAGEALQTAYGVVGVRSANQIQAELREVTAAMNAVRTSGELSGKALADAMHKAAVQVNALQVELRAVQNQSTFGDKFKAGFTSLAEGASSLINRFGALGASVGAVVFALKPFFDTIVQFDSMRRSLTAVTGSVAEAEKAIAFLRETANKSGVSISSISDAFVRFTASARTSGLSTEVVQKVFAATAQAAGNLGLSSDKLTHILDALSQMANKGVVSMEELRQQLGDSLPGALGLLAKGLGITEQQLVKLVETGQLLTVDALPALANALTTLGAKDGQVKGIAASFNILKNSITEAAQIAGDSKGFNLLLESMKFLGVVIALVVTRITQAADQLGILVSAVINANKAFFTLSTGPLKQIGEDFEAARARSKRLDDNLSQLTDRLYGTGDAATKTGDAMTSAGTKAEESAASYQTNATAQNGAAAAAQMNATAQAASGAATAAAGTQVEGALKQWYALGIAFAELSKRREQEIENAETYAKAAAIEGKTREQLAKLAGDEAVAIKVAADASANEAEKLLAVSTLRNQEIGAIQAQKAALEALATELGDPTGNRKKQIDALGEVIKARTAEAEKAAQSAEAMRLETVARETLVKTYADNSAKLDMLRSTYESTTRAVRALEAAFKAGLATGAQVDAARERSAVAESLYRDAVQDTVTQIELKTRAIESGYAIDKANVDLAKAKIDTEIALQTELKNTTAVYDLNIQKKKLDVTASRERITATEREIVLAKEQLELDYQAIKVNDPLRDQKLKELELRREAIRLREIEVLRSKELVTQSEKEIEILNRKQAMSLTVSENVVAGIEREIEARERANAMTQRAIDLENKRRGVNAQGFSVDKNGQQIGYGGQLNIPEGYYFDAEAANKDPRFQKGLTDGSEFIKPKGSEGGGALLDGTSSPTANTSRNYGNAGYSIFGEAAYEKNTPPSPPPAPPPQSSPVPPRMSQDSTYKVVIEMGTTTTTINTTDEASARNLVNLMSTISKRTA